MSANLVMLWPVLWSACAAAVDLRRREIPDVIPLVLITSLLGAMACGLPLPAWWDCLLAGGLALLVTIPGFSRSALGGGDVKLLVSLACWFGLVGTLGLLFWTALSGGLLAWIAAVRGRRDLAYGPAIALATLIQALLPAALPNLVRGLQTFWR
jgi:Flp pilus assembly protein protease CpaA